MDCLTLGDFLRLAYGFRCSYGRRRTHVWMQLVRSLSWSKPLKSGTFTRGTQSNLYKKSVERKIVASFEKRLNSHQPQPPYL
jgi:hypothetical protein